ncbi:hypothetical protein HGO38_14975 [Rhizobium sp. CG5]|uniref:hypothetical protein n=1 Tax=Rhizobium sp. CG5 TaxID=2726076 RepID=UPI0020335469|nr:hypothetical protein [Rhizobium sp. CG5]MCM2474781.1 hypothetical protein [Rhizobium sp. CG5]
MYALLTAIRQTTRDTPDTGTYADGMPSVASLDLQVLSRRERRSNPHARDYGMERKVNPDVIGYA